MGTGTGGKGIQETEDAAPQTAASPPPATPSHPLSARGKPPQQISRERERGADANWRNQRKVRQGIPRQRVQRACEDG